MKISLIIFYFPSVQYFDPTDPKYFYPFCFITSAEIISHQVYLVNNPCCSRALDLVCCICYNFYLVSVPFLLLPLREFALYFDVYLFLQIPCFYSLSFRYWTAFMICEVQLILF